MNKSNKRDAFRLMIFIKIVMKDYDSTEFFIPILIIICKFGHQRSITL